MSAQQKYLYQYAYLDGSSFNIIENNNLYNDERGEAEILQNYNHNSLNLKFKAGEHTAKALSVLLANNEVGLVLKAIKHSDITSTTFTVYDLVKIGDVNLSPNVHFYEVSSEFLSQQINNVDFFTKRVIPVDVGEGISGIELPIITVKENSNQYIINEDVLTQGITSFYYPTGNETNPLTLVDLRDMSEFSIVFNRGVIPDSFLSEYISDTVMTIENAGSVMKVGDNVFANSKFSDIVANFSGIRELGKNVNFAKSGATITPTNPMGLEPYDNLKIKLTSSVEEIDGLLIASDFFAFGSQKLLNDKCNALKCFRGTLTELRNCTIVENYGDLTNLDQSEIIFDNCEFVTNQDFSTNPSTQTLIIRNCNQKNEGSQEFTFTGFSGKIIIENSFKSSEATYIVSDEAAYRLEIDNNSFINVGENSGSLNKVLSSENRKLIPTTDPAGFLRVNGYNIISFSGRNMLTNAGDIIDIPIITNLQFSAAKKWDVKDGNFSFVEFNLSTPLRLCHPVTYISYIKSISPRSFYNFKHNSGMTIYLNAPQLLYSIETPNCLTTINDDNETELNIIVLGALDPDFNYLSILRNETSFKLNGITYITFDADIRFKEALMIQYPEYIYL